MKSDEGCILLRTSRPLSCLTNVENNLFSMKPSVQCVLKFVHVHSYCLFRKQEGNIGGKLEGA